MLNKAFHKCCRKSTHSYRELRLFFIWRSEVLIFRMEITNERKYEKNIDEKGNNKHRNECLSGRFRDRTLDRSGSGLCRFF